MIEFDGLHKSFGDAHVLRGLSFTARDGAVTGFVGPNGAGKSTAFKTLVGLLAADSGRVLVGGRSYAGITAPGPVLGAFLGAGAIPGTMTGIDYLRYVCDLVRTPRDRADKQLGAVGLDGSGGALVGGYSLGMRQRLGLAAALVAEPSHLVLDEPVNGLDVEGVRWMRDYLRAAADEGRCVLLSSHLLSELELVADDVVLLGSGATSGTAVASGPLDQVRTPDALAVRVVAADHPRLADHLRSRGAQVDLGAGALVVRARSVDWVIRTAVELDVALLEVSTLRTSLEDVYLSHLGPALGEGAAR